MTSRTLLLALTLLVAAAKTSGQRWGPEPSKKLGGHARIEDTCKRCCERKLPCPAICELFPCSPVPTPGTCPFVDKTVILCAADSEDLCSSDKACPKGQKCCDTGCRRSCSPVCRPGCKRGQRCIWNRILCVRAPCPQPEPGCEDIPQPPRPGTCPINDLAPRISCLRPVEPPPPCDESKCPAGQKCCNYGCGDRCIEPCLPACGPNEKCVRRTFAACLAIGCPPAPPPVTKCVLKDPCSVVRCRSGTRCDYRAVCKEIPPKAGSCPINDIQLVIFCPVNSKDKCAGDHDCSGDEKCCKYGCEKNCLAPCKPACREDQNCIRGRPTGLCDGPCPPPTTSCQAKDPCTLADCRPGTKCEVQGGEAKCVPLPPRPGVCPRVDIITTCQVTEDACSSDAVCKEGEKCCSYGCGPKCLPACSKPCKEGETCRLQPVPCLVPPCPEFARCVADKPKEKPGFCPVNDVITTCQVRSDACNSDADCGDDRKCCSRGCGKTCLPPCEKPCPFGEKCKYTKLKCSFPPCLDFSKCEGNKPVVHPGTCPKNKEGGLCVIDEDSCSSDAQCKPTEKCCSKGCGRKCVSVKPVVRPRPGRCPPNKSISICAITKDSCTSDKQCKRGQKCCPRGCGRECVSVKYVKNKW